VVSTQIGTTKGPQNGAHLVRKHDDLIGAIEGEPLDPSQKAGDRSALGQGQALRQPRLDVMDDRNMSTAHERGGENGHDRGAERNHGAPGAKPPAPEPRD
jgi:hypothetical protein